jgi:hypothetical protein
MMGVEEYKKCGGSSKLMKEYNAHRDSTMAATGNVTFSRPTSLSSLAKTRRIPKSLICHR